MTLENHETYMRAALLYAQKSAKQHEVPVGAVIVRDGKIIAKGRNRREHMQNALLHAEIEAIDKACRRIGLWRLCGCDLYVTLEPCPMCAGAIINSRISNVYYGAYDPKNGAAGSVCSLFDLPFNHKPAYRGGILHQQCKDILTNFFRKLRTSQHPPNR